MTCWKPGHGASNSNSGTRSNHRFTLGLQASGSKSCRARMPVIMRYPPLISALVFGVSPAAQVCQAVHHVIAVVHPLLPIPGDEFQRQHHTPLDLALDRLLLCQTTAEQFLAGRCRFWRSLWLRTARQILLDPAASILLVCCAPASKAAGLFALCGALLCGRGLRRHLRTARLVGLQLRSANGRIRPFKERPSDAARYL